MSNTPRRDPGSAGAGADAEEVTTGDRRILWHVLSIN
jgi:hypothetical protein